MQEFKADPAAGSTAMPAVDAAVDKISAAIHVARAEWLGLVLWCMTVKEVIDLFETLRLGHNDDTPVRSIRFLQSMGKEI